jgi:hypothetical protein
MTDDSRPYIDDIRDAAREGRASAATIAAWLEIRQEEHRREVRAHADQRMRDRLHSAVDSALSGDTPSRFAHLFPPSKPLGPATHEEEVNESLIYDGEQQGRRSRQPRTAASAGDDEDYNDAFPLQYRQWCGWGGAGE